MERKKKENRTGPYRRQTAAPTRHVCERYARSTYSTYGMVPIYLLQRRCWYESYTYFELARAYETSPFSLTATAVSKKIYRRRHVLCLSAIYNTFTLIAATVQYVRMRSLIVHIHTRRLRWTTNAITVPARTRTRPYHRTGIAVRKPYRAPARRRAYNGR